MRVYTFSKAGDTKKRVLTARAAKKIADESKLSMLVGAGSALQNRHSGAHRRIYNNKTLEGARVRAATCVSRRVRAGLRKCVCRLTSDRERLRVRAPERQCPEPAPGDAFYAVAGKVRSARPHPRRHRTSPGQLKSAWTRELCFNWQKNLSVGNPAAFPLLSIPRADSHCALMQRAKQMTHNAMVNFSWVLFPHLCGGVNEQILPRGKVPSLPEVWTNVDLRVHLS
jgi:hypothetical protein